MDIQELLKLSRKIWGNKKLTPEEVVVRLGVNLGDFARWVRNSKKDKKTHTDAELKKEIGNTIFSMIRWADDLGYDPEKCIELAIQAQEKFVKGGNR